jgi:nucleoside-diphosphate kinase
MYNPDMKKEQTLVVLKPDTVQRSLMGEVINRIERTGLKLVAAKMFSPSEKLLTEHYGKNDEWYLAKGEKRLKMIQDAGVKVDPSRPAIEYGKDIIRGTIRYMQACPVLATVWEGNEAVAVVKKLVGTTDPTTSDVGTIRGDYQSDSYSSSDVEQRSIRNLIHCTDVPSESAREINIWFTPEEIQNYRHINEAILEDVNIDGTNE